MINFIDSENKNISRDLEKILLAKDEQVDNLHINGLKIIQNKKMFMFGIDAVLLTAFAKVKKNDLIVDLCSGNGIIPLLLSENQCKKIIGLEIQSGSANLAIRSVKLNHLEDKVQIINDDIKNVFKYFEAQSVNVVTCNPPYLKNNSAVKNLVDCLSIARHEILCNIDDVLKSASYLLKPNGRLYLIHKPERIFEIYQCSVNYNLEIKRLRFIQPQIEKKATMVLLEFVKCANPGLVIESPLIVYKSKGEYSEEVLEVYKKC